MTNKFIKDPINVGLLRSVSNTEQNMYVVITVDKEDMRQFFIDKRYHHTFTDDWENAFTDMDVEGLDRWLSEYQKPFTIQSIEPSESVIPTKTVHDRDLETLGRYEEALNVATQLIGNNEVCDTLSDLINDIGDEISQRTANDDD